MYRLMAILLLLLSCIAALSADDTITPASLQAIRIPQQHLQRLPVNSTRQWQISQPPTMVMFSYYDYMIGGYNSLPMHIVPSEFEGGAFFTFHAKRTIEDQRGVYFAYMNADGVLQPAGC